MLKKAFLFFFLTLLLPTACISINHKATVLETSRSGCKFKITHEQRSQVPTAAHVIIPFSHDDLELLKIDFAQERTHEWALKEARPAIRKLMTGIEGKMSASYLLATPSLQTNIHLNITIFFRHNPNKSFDPESIKKSPATWILVDVISTHTHLPKYIEHMLKSVIMSDSFFTIYGSALLKTGLFAGAAMGIVYLSNKLTNVKQAHRQVDLIDNAAQQLAEKLQTRFLMKGDEVFFSSTAQKTYTGWSNVFVTLPTPAEKKLIVVSIHSSEQFKKIATSQELCKDDQLQQIKILVVPLSAYASLNHEQCKYLETYRWQVVFINDTNRTQLDRVLLSYSTQENSFWINSTIHNFNHDYSWLSVKEPIQQNILRSSTLTSQKNNTTRSHPLANTEASFSETIRIISELIDDTRRALLHKLGLTMHATQEQVDAALSSTSCDELKPFADPVAPQTAFSLFSHYLEQPSDTSFDTWKLQDTQQRQAAKDERERNQEETRRAAMEQEETTQRTFEKRCNTLRRASTDIAIHLQTRFSISDDKTYSEAVNQPAIEIPGDAELIIFELTHSNSLQRLVAENLLANDIQLKQIKVILVPISIVTPELPESLKAIKELVLFKWQIIFINDTDRDITVQRTQSVPSYTSYVDFQSDIYYQSTYSHSQPVHTICAKLPLDLIWHMLEECETTRKTTLTYQGTSYDSRAPAKDSATSIFTIVARYVIDTRKPFYSELGLTIHSTDEQAATKQPDDYESGDDEQPFSQVGPSAAYKMLKTTQRRRAYTASATHQFALQTQEVDRLNRIRIKAEAQKVAHFKAFDAARHLKKTQTFTHINGTALEKPIEQAIIISFYEILDVEQTATQEEIEEKHTWLTSGRVKLMQQALDYVTSRKESESFQEDIAQAYSALRNPALRQLYDAWLAIQMQRVAQSILQENYRSVLQAQEARDALQRRLYAQVRMYNLIPA